MKDRRLEELTPEQLAQIRESAETLLSERYRAYVPGGLLPMMIGRFRDDAAEALGIPLADPPQGSGHIRQVSLDELTSSELQRLTHVVLLLLTYADTMTDPGLPELLREFRGELVKQASEREEAVSKIISKAACS